MFRLLKDLIGAGAPPGNALSGPVPGLRRCLAVGLLVLSAPPTLLAQQLPPQVQPRPIVPPIPTVPVKPAPDLTVAPLAGGAPPGADQLMVTLWGIEIAGNTVYSFQELEEFYKDLLVTEIPLSRVFQIAEEIQKKYHDDGYLLTRVIIPAQNVSNGLYRIQVIEGFISDVKLEGDIGPVARRIERQLRELVGHRPINSERIERYLLLANDTPGITVRGVLRPGVGEVGASELLVKVERKRFEGYVVADNRGSEFTGPWRGAVALRENSSTSLGESIEVTIGSTLVNDEQRFAQLVYEQNIGIEGLKFQGVASYGPSEPGFTLESLGIETKTAFARASLTYPLIRSRKQNLFVNGGFDAIQSTVDVFGTQLTEDNLRVLHATATYDFVDRYGGRSSLSGGIRRGLDALGASENGATNLSRSEGQVDFTSLNADLWRQQHLAGKLGVLFASIGQYSFDTLLSDEECRLGGERFGRGYDPSEIAGEDCFAFTTELQYSGGPQGDILTGYQAYAYYDFGVVWNSDTFANPQDSLASTGIGIRTSLFNHLFLDFEIAKPLTRDVATQGNKDVRFFFRALARF